MEPIRITVQQRRVLEKAKADLEFAKRECAKARKAGIPCGEAEALVEEAEKVRDGILTTYGFDAKR